MPKSKETKEFKLGDRVTWASQAAGSWKTKTGVIIEVGTINQPLKHGNRTASKRHRYVVEVVVKHSRGEKKSIYYPSTSAINLVTSANN